MPAALLDSQFAALEPPAADENAVSIEVGRPPYEVAAEIIRRLSLRPEVRAVS